MTPVEQQFLVDRDGFGDCWAACLASILDLDRAEIPDDVWRTTEGEGSFEQDQRTRAWLWKRGFDLRYVNPWERRGEDDPSRYVIVCGTSPRELQHAVVGDLAEPITERRDDAASIHYKRDVFRNHIVIAHDPHPSRAGLRLQHQALEIIPLAAAQS